MENVRYLESGSIQADIDGQTFVIPDDMGNRYRQMVEDWVNQGNEIAPYAPPRPTSNQINAERERRIAQGISIQVTGIGTIPITGTTQDTRNLQSLFSVASSRIAMGDTTTITPFRDANNATQNLTPGQIVELFLKSTAYVSYLYDKSWTIKAMDPIPYNFADDEYWTD
ncbi:DUF4376 domain-containing protein [Rhizobium phage RHph_TM39]|nr:DUF4376 domain-containing protein [Rhizobium phage RHph_TM39]QIG77912.1 DUF4376 domain-containing protein [Rhizobium phage RHph_TM61]